MSDSKRVCVYLRVSTQDQNTALQKAELEQYCLARGLSISHIYEDKATGTNTARPEFQSMLKNARSRRFDVLLVWKLDRFARSLKDLVNNLTELTELGLEFISLKDNLDLSTSAGRLMLHMLGAFAEFEAALIKERVRAGIENAKRKGTKFGRPKVTNAEIVMRLRDEGLSLSAIAKRIGVSKTTVHNVLTRNQFTKSVNKVVISES